jgi:hypothetical protein
MTFAAVAVTALSISCADAADSGLYIGAGYGQAYVQDKPDNPAAPGTIDFSSNSGASQVFIGYRLRAIPLVDFAAEAGYSDFGKASETVQGQNVQYKLRGEQVSGLAILPLGPLDFYGKVGAMYWTSDKDIGETTSSKTGTNAFYGAGMGFKVWKLGVRAEYDYYDVPNIDRVQSYSASVLFFF